MVLRNAGRLTDAAIVRNPILQDLRNTVVKFALGFPQLGHRVGDLLAELNIGYPKSPLTVEGAHRASGTKAGARWPDRLPANPGNARFTAVGPADIVFALAAKFPKLVQAAAASGRADARDLSLVRPDGYVGFAGAASDRAGAEAPEPGAVEPRTCWGSASSKSCARSPNKKRGPAPARAARSLGL
jgi:hypothetical protein